MDTAKGLPLPSLSRGRFSAFGSFEPENGPQENRGDDASMTHGPFSRSGHFVHAYTDVALFDATGVRIVFTERCGGSSEGVYASLDLACHVGDDPRAVGSNRELLLDSIGCSSASLIVPKQVHGNTVVQVDGADGEAFISACEKAQEGADALVVECADVCALLCYADCMPVIIVAPGGHFAVVHDGWRGVDAHITLSALDALCASAHASAGDCNVYIGPYIHAECFEVSAELAQHFKQTFGAACILDERHIDLGAAIRIDLLAAGIDSGRIADVDACTVCENDRFFSYRAQGGVCGRHAACAVREI